jgi:hypothetical protein
MHVIRTVNNAEAKAKRSLVEWQTKTLAGFIASTIQDNKARDEAFAAVEKLSITGDDPEADTSGEDTRSLDEVMKHGDVQRALARNMKRKGPGIFGMN